MFVDSHAHIDGAEYDADRDEVVARAKEAGIVAILNVGTGDPHGGNLERAIEVAEKYENVFASVGVHPHDARLFDEMAERILAGLLHASPRVVALGEIGLDYHYDNSPRDVQRKVFRTQLMMARKAGLPVIIHSREADEDTAAIISEELTGYERAGVMHCFGGSWALAEAALKSGFMISFAGNLTFKNARDLREIAARIPLDRLLIETDCPYLSPVPFRGRRNEPARVLEVANCLAELHEKSREEMGLLTTRNFEHLFGVSLSNFHPRAV